MLSRETTRYHHAVVMQPKALETDSRNIPILLKQSKNSKNLFPSVEKVKLQTVAVQKDQKMVQTSSF
jgi:hypothetical protein